MDSGERRHEVGRILGERPQAVFYFPPVIHPPLPYTVHGDRFLQHKTVFLVIGPFT